MKRLLDFDPMTGRTMWHTYDSHTNETTIETTFDVEPVIEFNKAMQNHTDGWTPSRDMRYVGEIPNGIIHKWLIEEGIDVFNKDHWPAVKRKLNSNEYRYLRTSLWTI